MTYPDSLKSINFADYIKPTPRNRFLYRIFYESLAWALIILVPFCSLAIALLVMTYVFLPDVFLPVESAQHLTWQIDQPDQHGVIDVFLMMLLPVVVSCTYIAVSLIYRRLFLPLRYKARNYSVQPLKQMRDSRPPILYLRSFRSDDERHLSFRRSEVVLVSLLKTKGPVITIGRPGEKIPPVGALRLYFNSTEWQEKVATLISMSKFVVIQAAYSDSLAWEVSTAINLLGLERVLFYVGHWNEINVHTANLERELFVNELNETCSTTIQANDLIGAVFILFDRDRKPKIYKSGSLSRDFRNQSKFSIRKALQQLLEDSALLN